MLEHGAYTLMLDAHYASGNPLPLDIDRLHRLLVATTRAEQAAVTMVLDEFWTKTEAGWTNRRAGKELEAYAERAETNRRIAREREENRHKVGDVVRSTSRSTVRAPHEQRFVHQRALARTRAKPETRNQKPDSRTR